MVHRLALEEQLAGVDVEVAGQGLDHRGLPGAVVADEGDDLAGVDVEVGIVSARTCPKLRDSPRASRMGAILSSPPELKNVAFRRALTHN